MGHTLLINPNQLRHRGRLRIRRGVASVLAMLFIALFAVLSVGFYASTTVSVQVSRNDQRTAEAQAAAESALQWGRRQMVRANFVPTSDPAVSLTNLYNTLSTQLSGTANMNGRNPSRSTDASGNAIICIPGATGSGGSISYNWMPLGGNGGWGRLTLRRSGNAVLLKAVGAPPGPVPTASTVTRAVQLQYNLASGAWTPFGSGLLSRAPISLSNGARISGGDVMVATAQSNIASITMSGGTQIDQNFAYVAGAKPPSLSNGASIDGTITANAPAPSFPQIDTSAFAAFVPSASAPQGPKVITASSSLTSTQKFTNIRIKANANTSFGNSQEISGVIYIESPNKVTFGGGMRITGIIVTDNDYSKPLSGNTITIGNGVRMDGLAELDPTAFSASENITALKQMAGIVVLAPNYKVTLQGGSRTFNDSLVAEQFDISNGYRGTIAGVLLNLGDNLFTMMGGGRLTFTSGTSSYPGLTGRLSYAVDLTTYSEVTP